MRTSASCLKAEAIAAEAQKSNKDMLKAEVRGGTDALAFTATLMLGRFTRNHSYSCEFSAVSNGEHSSVAVSTDR